MRWVTSILLVLSLSGLPGVVFDDDCARECASGHDKCDGGIPCAGCAACPCAPSAPAPAVTPVRVAEPLLIPAPEIVAVAPPAPALDRLFRPPRA